MEKEYYIIIMEVNGMKVIGKQVLIIMLLERIKYKWYNLYLFFLNSHLTFIIYIDKYEGKGIYYYDNGSKMYEGEWKAGID